MASPTSLYPSRLSDSPASSSFPSELPTPKSAGFRSLSLDDAKTPITPPPAYMDFLKTSLVMRTPTSATFRDLPLPVTSAPLSAACTCHSRRSFRRPSTLRRSSADSNSSRESSFDSTTSSVCCSNYCYYPPPTPYTPVTPSSIKTPLSGTKRLRIPPSPAFSPNYSPSSFENPFPIYATPTPRTPITEEDEEDMLDAAILSANGDRSSRHPACRHKKVVTIRTDSSAAMSKASRMKLMAAPKGKKRRVD